MIIEYLPSTLKYLLGDVDSKGHKRPSTIVGGCYDSFMREIEQKSSKKKGYVTFCYRDKKPLAELGGSKFLASLMDDILEKFYPNMDKSNFQHLFILHDNPKHDFELNFVAAESVGGRYFPVYFDKYDRKYFEAFGRYIHKKYPKLTDPNSPELRRGLVDANKYWNSSQQSLFLRLKKEMSEYGKAINNREDFERFLKQSNFIINRKTDTSITVKSGDTKIKLTGNLCNNGNTHAIDSENIDVDKLYKELSQTRYARLKNKYKYLKNYEYPKQRNNIGQHIKDSNANSVSDDSAVYGNPHERIEKSRFADSQSSSLGLSGNSSQGVRGNDQNAGGILRETSGGTESTSKRCPNEYYKRFLANDSKINRKLRESEDKLSEFAKGIVLIYPGLQKELGYNSALIDFQKAWDAIFAPSTKSLMRLFLKIIIDMEIFLYGKNQQKTQKQHMGQPMRYPPPRSWTGQAQPARDTQRGYDYDR